MPLLRDLLISRAISRATAPVRRLSLPRFFSRRAASPFSLLSADGTRLHADVYPARAAHRGTVILAHGYRDGRTQLAFLARPLTAHGHRVIALDFRAHGRSEGTRVTVGAREADDVRAVLAAARTMESTTGRVAFLGYSMGASAYLLSQEEADVAVLDSPYDTLERALAARVRRFRLPTHVAELVAREGSRQTGVDLAGVRPIDRVPHLTRPTLFVFARRDPWIDADTREAFARVLPTQASMRVVEGGHRLHFGRAWESAVVRFLVGAGD